MAEEAERYGLKLEQNTKEVPSATAASSSSSRAGAVYERKRWLFCHDEVRVDFTAAGNRCPVPAAERGEFDRVMRQMNYDASILTFETGFDQLNGITFDLSYWDYVIDRLKATNATREFLFSQVRCLHT